MQTVNSLQRRNTFKVRCVPAPLETTEIKSFSDLGLGKVPASLHESPADNDADGDQDANDDVDNDDDDDDDDNDDNGYPAYSHQSYSHQVGICHHD